MNSSNHVPEFFIIVTNVLNKEHVLMLFYPQLNDSLYDFFFTKYLI